MFFQETPGIRGVRRRGTSGKWVSEIREPKSPTGYGSAHSQPQKWRLSLTMWPALTLKGGDAQLNFPDSASSLPVPLSTSSHDIQAACHQCCRFSWGSHGCTGKLSCDSFSSGNLVCR
ncbi:putative transcription factor AP2-EREBP family [Helianthus debilis subsp. tardiflorus]